MASLNLVPNPEVLVVQTGVFLVAMVVIKKLLLEPYLKVRDLRERLTLGSKDEAVHILAECEKLTQAINTKLSVAAGEAKAGRDKIRDAALARRAEVLTQAESEAKAHVETVERQIQQELGREKAKVPQVVAQLTDEVYKLALS